MQRICLRFHQSCEAQPTRARIAGVNSSNDVDVVRHDCRDNIFEILNKINFVLDGRSIQVIRFCFTFLHPSWT